MSDVSNTGGKVDRKRVSTRQYFDSKGEKSVGPDSAGYVTYTLLDEAGKALKSWDWKGDQFSQFGFVTKVGNVANSILNGDDPGTRTDAAAEIDEFITAVGAGTWREPGEGGPRGPRFDKAVLAAALVSVLGAKAQGDAASYQARLDDKAYYAKVRTNAKVMAQYHADMAGKAEATDAEALA